MTAPTLIAPINIMDADEEVNLSDPLRPTGPYGIAKSCEAKIAALEAQREVMLRSGRKAINGELHRLRSLMNWCKTRAGYVEPETCNDARSINR